MCVCVFVIKVFGVSSGAVSGHNITTKTDRGESGKDHSLTTFPRF